jgi:hypothetical protein
MPNAVANLTVHSCWPPSCCYAASRTVSKRWVNSAGDGKHQKQGCLPELTRDQDGLQPVAIWAGRFTMVPVVDLPA